MATNQQRKQILVYSHPSLLPDPVLMGTLSATVVRGKEVFAFEYNVDFLESESVFEMDPNLRLYKGLQYLSEEERNFGIFLDCSPDRWGRVLMDRREAVKARFEARPGRRLMESDYLLGVYDELRMGALRFKTDVDGPFLDNDSAHSTPPMTSLRELERAAKEFEEDISLDDKEYVKRLSLLIAPGSSLGGARPKASVLSERGHVWIAKFPGKNDEFDVGAWEYVIYKLALKSKIDMAKSKADTFYSNKTTFMTKRFDRDDNGRRYHFFSAMTLLGYQDGADAHAGVSYLELVELLQARGANVSYDLEQLWRRILFSVCVSNTDDHLRNHGFILTNRGLRLSPAYDINPNPKGYGLTLNIDEQDNRLDKEIVLSVAPFFRVSHTAATQIINEIEQVVKSWRKEAVELNVSAREIEEMSSAFLPYQS